MFAEIVPPENLFILSLNNKDLPTKEVIEQGLEYMISFEIESSSDLNRAGFISSGSKDLLKNIEEDRKFEGEPHRKKVESINKRYKQLTAPLEEIIILANKKLNDYEKSLELKKRNDQSSELDDLFGPILTAKEMKPRGAHVVTKNQITIELLDIKMVPLQYLKIDEEKIKEALKGGLTVPGINVKQEQITQFRKR